LLAGLLARSGHRVVCLARPDTVAVLRRDGLTVRSGQYGEFSVPVEAQAELAQPVDACLVTVKATALGSALACLPPEVLGAGLVVPLLNGVDHMALLRDRYAAAQVVAGAIRVESARVAVGRIEHTSPFASIELASSTAPRDRLEQLAAQLRAAGPDVTVRDDENTMLWSKLTFLAPLALLTTHSGAPAGTVRTQRRAELLAVIGEIAAVARAVGAPVDADALVGSFDRVPAAMKSSMQRDAEAGRAIELDAIGGVVLRAAERHGVEVPVTARLVADLRDGRAARPDPDDPATIG
jgi:2-dehydropantoate 2-reductase